MNEDRKEFLEDIESEITKRTWFQNFYKILRVVLMVTIAICGFFTATASQVEKVSFLDKTSIMWFGLLSAVCAVLNQSLSPSASNIFHQNIRKAMEYIKGEVQFSNMEISKAHKLKSLATTEPEAVLGKLKDIFDDD